MIKAHVMIADPALAERIATACKAHAEVSVRPPGALPNDGGVIIADGRALEAAGRVDESRLLVVGSGNINDDVELLGRHSKLSQLVTPDLFEGPHAGRLLRGIPRLNPSLPPIDTMAFLGAGHLHVRRVLFYRSSDIDKRLDRVAQFAELAGAGRSVIDRLYEMGHELLANAFWDAPYEAGQVAQPTAREVEVRLDPDRPVELIYGVLDKELFLRVRDCYGALQRHRLVEVLLRCARGSSAVPLDESRGGAGLGLWRVFRNSTRVVISVVPGTSTEMLVTVPLLRNARAGLRAWHLVFAPPLYADSYASRSA
jgi:hypothetical protein